MSCTDMERDPYLWEDAAIDHAKALEANHSATRVHDSHLVLPHLASPHRVADCDSSSSHELHKVSVRGRTKALCQLDIEKLGAADSVKSWREVDLSGNL